MKLYFTADAKIVSESSVLFNQIALDIRKPFTDFIESISKQHAKSIDWWISFPASRNTFASPLFHYCCCLALLQKLLCANEPINEISTDSRAFKKIIEDYLAKHGANARVKLARLPLKQRLKELGRPIYTILGLPLKHLRLFFAAKLTRDVRKPLPSEPLTLIDTFVYSSSTDDRHYPGMMNVLTEEERKTIYFVPSFYRPKNLLLLVRKLRTGKNNFLLKEDVLKTRDYFFGWQHLKYIYQQKILPCFFLDMDISSLVKEELRNVRGIPSAYISLLNYKFVKRLRQADIKIRLFVNWFENQVVDKGLNAGFNQFYPDIPSIGYQGFIVAPHYLCLYPTIIEKASNVLPKEVAVIGRELINSVKENCPDLNVSVAPAFRFKGVWENRKYYPKADIFTIMVALPGMLDVGNEILNLLELCLKMKELSDVRFWIKQHPDNNSEMIKRRFEGRWPARFRFVGGDFNDRVEKSNLLISTGSSSCMHALSKGIPVIIIGSQMGLWHNPIPPDIEEDLWRFCCSIDELSSAIESYLNRDEETLYRHKMIGNKIRKEYLESVTRDAVTKFLKFTD